MNTDKLLPVSREKKKKKEDLTRMEQRTNNGQRVPCCTWMSDYRSSGIQNHRLVNRETCPTSAVQSSAIDRGNQTTAEPRLWGDPTHAF